MNQENKITTSSDKIPIRGLTKEQLKHVKREDLVEVFDAGVGIFKLGHGPEYEKDVKEYQKILDNGAKGLYIILDELNSFVNDEKSPYFLIVIRYHKLFMELATGKTNEQIDP